MIIRENGVCAQLIIFNKAKTSVYYTKLLSLFFNFRAFNAKIVILHFVVSIFGGGGGGNFPLNPLNFDMKAYESIAN